MGTIMIMMDLDGSEEYCRKKKNDNNDNKYFLSEETDPPHY